MAEKDQYDGSTEGRRSTVQNAQIGCAECCRDFRRGSSGSDVILAPVIERKSARLAGTVAPGAYDEIVTGSISTNSGPKRYIVRRSVLQDTPGAVCIINSDGSTSGC